MHKNCNALTLTTVGNTFICPKLGGKTAAERRDETFSIVR